MTKVITRYFDSVDAAQSARRELVVGNRLPWRIVHLFDDANGLADELTAAHVAAPTAKAYQDRVKTGGAVLLVQAGFKPLGVARITRDVCAAMGAVDMGNLTEEIFVDEPPKKMLSVLSGAPLMLSKEKDPYSTNYHMADWPIPLIKRRKPGSAAPLFPPHARMASFPVPLTIRTKPFTASIFSRHGRMANFPLPLISKRKPYTGTVFPRHARMAAFPISLTSRRKPFTGTMIGRHTRMANWPFPHLINGKMGTNALMPDGPRMANFPIPLLSKRKPSNKSIFGKHARMANFPLPLLSKRKPKDRFAFPRHARMADMILPLVIRNSKNKPPYGSEVFSISRLLRMPTVIRR